MKSYTDVVVSSLREAVLFNLIGVSIALVALVIFCFSLSDSFVFIFLMELTALMLIGGAMGVAGQATTRKITEWISRRKLDEAEVTLGDRAAALYALTGCLLFAEVFVMAFLLA